MFEGGEFVSIPGRHTTHISEASVRELLEAFRRAEYFSAEDSYIAQTTDVPTYTTSLAIDGRRKTIVDYFGQEAGMPDAIQQVERKIDEVAGTARWTETSEAETVAVLDSEKWDFRASTADNMSIYSEAIRRKNAALLTRYLNTRAPVVAPSASSPSPICVASGEADLALVQRMTKPDPVNSRDAIRQVAIPMRVMNQCLASATAKGDLATLQYWLDMGANPTMQAESTLPADRKERPSGAQTTLLVEAISSRKADVVRKVLEYEVDMRAPSGEPSLLFLALRMECADTPAIVESLLKAGADVNERDGFQHQTALFLAYAAPEAASTLLAAGADIEARDDDGQTPLIRGAMVEPMGSGTPRPWR